MINIVRNIKPSLISLATATRALDQSCLDILADTILFAERNYIHKFRSMSVERNEWVDDLLHKFASQMGIIDENDVKDFKVAGLAIMLSDDLSPHVDGMNPKGEHDLTVQFNCQIAVSDLDPECQNLVHTSFGHEIAVLPFSLIVYPRKCLVNYGSKMKAISDFPQRCPMERQGRTNLVSVLGDVGSSLDYNTRCFTRDGYSRRVLEMFPKDLPRMEFIHAQAAIDKMVSDSSSYIRLRLFSHHF